MNPGNFFVRSFFVALVLGGLLNVVSSPALSRCLGPGETWVWVPHLIPKGLGIKRIHFSHGRDENMSFFMSFVSLPATTSAHYIYETGPNLYLQNRDQVDVVPSHPDLRNGRSDATVGYNVGGEWYWNNGPMQISRIDHIQYTLRYVDNYFTSCTDPFPNTVVTVLFSNSPGH